MKLIIGYAILILLHIITRFKYPFINLKLWKNSGGVYDYKSYTIYINPPTYKFLIEMIIHEYIHHIQYNLKYGYTTMSEPEIEKYNSHSSFLSRCKSKNFNKSFCRYLKKYKFEKEAYFTHCKLFGLYSSWNLSEILISDAELYLDYIQFNPIKFLVRLEY